METRKLAGPLIYLGVGIYSVFLLFSLASIWFNAAVFSGLTLKIGMLLLLGVSVVALRGRFGNRPIYALAGLLALLFATDRLTVPGPAIQTFASHDLVACTEAKVQAEKDVRGGSAREDRDYYDGLISALQSPSYGLKQEHLQARDERVQALTATRDGYDLSHVEVTVDFLEDLYALDHALEKEKSESKEQAAALMWAKTYEPLILFGVFLMLLGALAPAPAAQGAHAAVAPSASVVAPVPAAGPAYPQTPARPPVPPLVGS